MILSDLLKNVGVNELYKMEAIEKVDQPYSHEKMNVLGERCKLHSHGKCSNFAACL
jgi:hypothetical protein